MKIMVVDDTISFRKFVGPILTEKGYEVIKAGDGKEAIIKLLNNSVHLILADLYMPNMDGLELLRKIKKSTVHKSTPVIMITSEAENPKYWKQCLWVLRAGC